MKEKARILVIDDQAGMRRSLAILLRKEEYYVVEAENGQHAITFLRDDRFDIVITDLKMSPGTGLDVLFFVRERLPLTEVIVMTGYGTVESAVIAMRMGAFDYISKPFKNEEILHRVLKTLNHIASRRTIERLEQVNLGGSPLIGSSGVMETLRDLITRLARVDLPVLITGETGTGKNLVARTIHHSSPRASAPFVSVNCAGVPENLLESELFGHVKGAFTGAFLERKGLFQEAEGGTLLLDEVGSMPVTMQAKLLDCLQEQTVRPVGSNRQVRFNVRIITATNADLVSAISQGNFREDLYYRIRVSHVHIPPLREHREDVPHLVRHALEKLRQEYRRPGLDMAPEASALLQDYDFPGNVRELLNAVSSASAMALGDRIERDDIAMTLTSRIFDVNRRPADDASPSTLEQWEGELIRQSIEKHSRNLSAVCSELGIARTTLWRKMNKYGLN